MEQTVYTIGHSNHPIEKFVNLLKLHKINVVCDVRSSPYSRFHEQYNREMLKQSLKHLGITYVFLGKELGARSEDPACYNDGRVQYDLLAKTHVFQKGVERLRRGVSQGYRMSLMCAEKDPLDCHRTVLVARKLDQENFNISHILSDGNLETQEELTERLIKQFNLNQKDLFFNPPDVMEEAFRQQEEKIAYSDEKLYANAEQKVAS